MQLRDRLGAARGVQPREEPRGKSYQFRVDAKALCRRSSFVADRTNLTHSGISIGLLRRLTRGEAQTDHQVEIWTLNSAEAVPIDLG
jgi:hypothetical protein